MEHGKRKITNIKELNVLLKFEPKLYKASTNIFKDSYDYTQKYKNFIELNKNK